MRYLLDTNICVYLIRQKSSVVLQHLTQLAFIDVAVSSITVAELQYGVAKSSAPQQNQIALDHFLLPLTIIPFDETAAGPYGEIRTYLESQGAPIGAMDLMIAAQAQSLGLIVVTNNVREFSRVPNLAIEDWTKP
jgi:tRNA(fMet)-specific endonuclease VapC